ncbi:MAG: MerR family transcriptional regulator, partial [Rhodoglobus sp.]
ERTGLSLRTLRHYDEIGLLRASGRSDGGYRLYTEEDVDRLMLIRRMKPLGYSLEEMAELLRAADDAEAGGDVARERLTGFIHEAEDRREVLEAQLGMADEFLRLLRSRLT